MRWLWLFVPLFLFACGDKTKPAPPKEPAKEITFKILLGETTVGSLNIKPGEFGTFIAADNDEGRKLQKRWEEEKKIGSIAGPSMHLPTNDGSRGPLGARLYKPADSDFADGVRAYLEEDNYIVKVISNAAALAATQPVKPESDALLEVYKDGVKLGLIYIKPGEFGTLIPEANPDAEELRILWEKSRAEKKVQVKFQLPAKDGMAGASGARVYRPEKRGFAVGVKGFLRDNGYEVKELPASQPASQSATQSASQPASRP